MKMRTNFLANIFDWLGVALERFNPSAFRFLAASLPYLTPVPVAWLTAHSSAEFLKLPPGVAFVFVFALEGIGLWFTSLLVDAIVDWIRSRNWRSFVPVVLFAAVVYAYVRLLIDLNVTLEMANGTPNPAMSRVITLMCYLPLITGVGNGYYKLKLEHKTQLDQEQQWKKEREEKEHAEQEAARIRQEQAAEAERVRQAQLALRMEQMKLDADVKAREATEADRSRQAQIALHMEQMRLEAESKGRESAAAERLEKYRLRQQTNVERPNEPKPRTNGHRTNGSERSEQIRSFVRQVETNEQRTPGPTEIAKTLGVSKSYASETLQVFLKERKPE
jgi:hypothetical protein